MIKKRLAINGFGRIGRTLFRNSFESKIFDVVVINDIGDLDNLLYLLKHDTAYGLFDKNIEIIRLNENDSLVRIDEKEVVFTKIKKLEDIDWNKYDIDIVVECSGAFLSCNEISSHLKAGAKKVILSAPFADCVINDEPHTVLVGVNDDSISKNNITSNGSCTTNALSPVIEILKNEIGIEKALINTIHAYTASQRVVDSTNSSDYRIGRAAAYNLIPSSTGATTTLAKVFLNLVSKIDGIAIRAPIITGSIADITFISSKSTSIDEINTVLINASKEDKWKDIFTVTNEPIVSSDVIGAKYGSIVDLNMTRVVDKNLVKIFSWYDNEAGYVSTLIKHINFVVDNI